MLPGLRFRPVCTAAILLGFAGLPVRAAVTQEPDALITWIERGSLAFLVRGDTVHGVQLWANALAAVRGGAEPRTFAARYDPAAILTWVAEAELLLLPDRVGPNDPPSLLAVTPLKDLQGGRLVAARRRDGSRWNAKATLSFEASGNEPLTISVERSLATELFDALAASARRSRLRDRALTSRLNSCGNTDTAFAHPQRITNGPVRYPDSLRDSGIPGLTVLSFIVDTDGRPRIDDGLQVIFSSHPLFTRAALEAVAGSRFLPATRRGTLTPVSVCQPVLFMISRSTRGR